MKFEDILELERLEYLSEATELFTLSEALSIDPKIAYQIVRRPLISKDAADCLGRPWLFNIIYPASVVNPRKSNLNLWDVIVAMKQIPAISEESMVDVIVAWLRWFDKHYNKKIGLSFVRPCIDFKYETFLYKGEPFWIGSKFDYLYHSAFLKGESLPRVIQDYLGFENIIYRDSCRQEILELRIQTIGHVLFSTENSHLRWSQTAAKSHSIFGTLAQEYEGCSPPRPLDRNIRDALKSIIPVNCRKRGNRDITEFSNDEINQLPLPIPTAITSVGNAEKIDFGSIADLVNCVIVTRALQLSKERSSMRSEELLGLPVLNQIQKHLNQSERKCLLWGISSLIRE